MPAPPADTPMLKYRAWAAKRDESGISRIAKGSSNDCSISEIEISCARLNGGLFQSKSIITLYTDWPYYVFTLYLRTDHLPLSSGKYGSATGFSFALSNNMLRHIFAQFLLLFLFLA